MLRWSICMKHLLFYSLFYILLLLWIFNGLICLWSTLGTAKLQTENQFFISICQAFLFYFVLEKLQPFFPLTVTLCFLCSHHASLSAAVCLAHRQANYTRVLSCWLTLLYCRFFCYYLCCYLRGGTTMTPHFFSWYLCTERQNNGATIPLWTGCVKVAPSSRR